MRVSPSVCVRKRPSGSTLGVLKTLKLFRNGTDTRNKMNPGAQTFPITINRASEGISWGFRLTGGADFNAPVSIAMVSSNSLKLCRACLILEAPEPNEVRCCQQQPSCWRPSIPRESQLCVHVEAKQTSQLTGPPLNHIFQVTWL